VTLGAAWRSIVACYALAVRHARGLRLRLLASGCRWLLLGLLLIVRCWRLCVGCLVGRHLLRLLWVLVDAHVHVHRTALDDLPSALRPRRAARRLAVLVDGRDAVIKPLALALHDGVLRLVQSADNAEVKLADNIRAEPRAQKLVHQVADEREVRHHRVRPKLNGDGVERRAVDVLGLEYSRWRAGHRANLGVAAISETQELGVLRSVARLVVLKPLHRYDLAEVLDTGVRLVELVQATLHHVVVNIHAVRRRENATDLRAIREECIAVQHPVPVCQQRLPQWRRSRHSVPLVERVRVPEMQDLVGRELDGLSVRLHLVARHTVLAGLHLDGARLDAVDLCRRPELVATD